jgi:DNA-binding NarL/FixJ family response regulator
MGSLRLLIADDHEIFRGGLRSLLEDEPGWQVVAEASNGREAVAEAEKTHPDVALLDIGMPVLNGLEAAHEIVRMAPQTKIMMLTVHDSEAMIHKVLACGARACLFKTDAARDLVNAVKAVQGHSTYFTPKVDEVFLNRCKNNRSRTAAGKPHAGCLTARQLEITQLLAQGRTNKEVAAFLEISVKTAETHRAHLMRRLNCRSAAELVRYAVRNQIIEA